jgi:1-acyl-sn-glycerol-3-phosphate acyltransferase
MILKAKHHFIIYPFFKWYAGFIIKRHYGTVKIIGDLKEKNQPILLISNHTSWWDGFWAMYINLNVLHRKYHFMMLEEQLHKYWFFNYTGGFSVNKKSKSIIETLNYTSELLTDSKNMVLIFPQGEIQSLHNQNIQFEKGLEWILKNKENTVQIVFLVNLIDYFSNRKPGIYFHIQEYTDDGFDLKSIHESYNLFYAESVEKQKNFKM